VVSVGGGNIDELMKQKYELNIKEYWLWFTCRYKTN
jgi:hypothetical protein